MKDEEKKLDAARKEIDRVRQEALEEIQYEKEPIREEIEREKKKMQEIREHECDRLRLDKEQEKQRPNGSLGYMGAHMEDRMEKVCTWMEQQQAKQLEQERRQQQLGAMKEQILAMNRPENTRMCASTGVRIFSNLDTIANPIMFNQMRLAHFIMGETEIILRLQNPKEMRAMLKLMRKLAYW